MNVITAADYDPYKYFMQMTLKHKNNWRALFITKNKAARTLAMRTLFNLLEDNNIPCTLRAVHGTLTAEAGSVADFRIGHKNMAERLAGMEYQQIDGTEHLKNPEDEKFIRTRLRTNVSIPLAKDMVIR